MYHIVARQNALLHETERLAKLHSYDLIKSYDTSGTFQHVVGMAAHIFNIPLAVVNFVDEKVVITESSFGVNGPREIVREETLCSLAILRDEVTVFDNTKLDPCIATHPFVQGELGLQFYAAAPLRTSDGYNIGVIAVADLKPRHFSKEDEQMLEALAAIIMTELEGKVRYEQTN